MSRKNKITESNPRTGALPSEQQANAGADGGVQNALVENDRLIYELVERNVQYCGEQLNESLQFNSETLTDVLYRNLYDLIGGKIDEDEFVQWAAQELVARGCVIRQVDESSSEENGNESSETVVESLDGSEYDALVQKVYAAIELVKSRKLAIFRLFSDVDGTITEIEGLGEQSENAIQVSETQLQERDEHIRRLIQRLESNQNSIESYATTLDENKNEFKENLNQISEMVSQSKDKMTEVADGINSSKKEKKKENALKAGKAKSPIASYALVDTIISQYNKIDRDAKKKKKSSGGIFKGKNIFKDITGKKGGGFLFGGKKKGTGIFGKSSGRRNFLAKPSLASRAIGKLKQTKAGRAVGAVSRGIKKGGGFLFGGKKKGTGIFGKSSGRRNFLAKPSLASRAIGKLKQTKAGRAVGAVSRGIKKVGRAVGAVSRGIKKVGRAIMATVALTAAAVVGTVRTAVKATKAFVKVSGMVGKGLVKGAVGLFNWGKKVVNEAVDDAKAAIDSKGTKGSYLTIFNGSGATLVTKFALKIGWAAVKFVGRAIWKLVKKATKTVLGLLVAGFVIGARFVNTVAFYAAKIGAGIKNMAYRFLIKPIAGILCSVFGFAMSMLKAPIQFMKWMVKSVFERISAILTNIKETTTRVLKATWGIFKKILFNPITIIILIGALFYFFWPKIQAFFSGGFKNLKESVITPIVGFAKKIGSFLATAFTVVTKIAKFIWKVVNWITNPEGMIAKFIVGAFNTVRTIKKWINSLIKASGKSGIDAFCMWLAGDWIGLILTARIGLAKKIWGWIKRVKIFKVIKNIFKAVVGYFIMWAKIWGNLIWAVCHPIKSGLAKHPIDTIKNVFANPIIEWIGKLKALWDEDYVDVKVEQNPTVTASEQMGKSTSAVRNLKKVGFAGEKNLAYMDSLNKIGDTKSGQSIIDRLEFMNKISQQNLDQGQQYEKFITSMWEMGKGNELISQRVISTVLESPELSQRLLSAFYFQNPETGEVMSLFPASYVGDVVKNIQEMVSGGEMNATEILTEIVKSFDQANKERMYIVTEHMKKVEATANMISSSTTPKFMLDSLAKKINSKSLMSEISMAKHLKDFMEGGGPVTSEVDGVTGEKLGKSKILTPRPENPMKVKDLDDSQFKVPPPPKKNPNRKGNIILSPGMAKNINGPKPIKVDPKEDADMVKKWKEHQKARHKAAAEGKNEKQLEDMGLHDYTYDEWKKKQMKKGKDVNGKMTPEEMKKRLADARMMKDIQAYQNQGQVANPDGLTLGEKQKIYKIKTDGLSQTLFLFSPQWEKMKGASKISDAELLGELEVEDQKAKEEMMKKAKEEQAAAEAKKAAEERERKREQEILDYSAKVEGGFIEVKIGEDVTAMREAWETHQRARAKASAAGKSPEELEKMGLHDYTWEEWKKYYRRMHGLPEDGIKRIPFEGKKKQRVVDWSPRAALSSDEMAKLGIEMSKDGPVMIPLAKAMEASGSLIDGAKTIYSVRDGLDIMRQGLITKTKEMQKMNEEGPPVIAAQTEEEQSPTTEPLPPPSNPQQNFESRF